MPNYIETIFDACRNSSNVSRRVMLLLIASVAFVFTVTWKGDGWESERISRLKAAKAISTWDSLNGYPEIKDLRKIKEKAITAEQNEKADKEVLQKAKKDSPWIKGIVDSGKAEKFTLNEVESALYWLGTYETLLTPKVISKKIEDAKSTPSSEGQIVIPIFGIPISINDITFYSGVLLTTILVFLCFFLYREKSTLSLFIDAISNLSVESKSEYYNGLAAHQVLTFASKISAISKHTPISETLLTYLSKSLYLFPILVQWYSLKTDLDTMTNGWKVSIEHTSLNINMGWVLTLIVTLLSLFSIIVARNIDNTWSVLRGIVLSSPPPAQEVT